MVRPQKSTHEIHGHAHSKAGSNLISTSSNMFVVPFCVILMRIRSSHHLVQTLVFFSSIISHLQLLFTCTYPMASNLWLKIPASFNLTQIFSVFTRLLPQNLTYVEATRSAYIICLIITISFISLTTLLVFYRPNSIFNPNSLPFLPTFSIILLRIICLPMVSLTFYFWFERNQSKGFLPAILCTVCLLFCIFGCKIYDNIIHCLPNFPKLYGTSWSLPNFYIILLGEMIAMGLCESMAYVNLKWEQILLSSIITILFAIFAYRSICFCDGLLFDYNVLHVFIFLSGTLYHFIGIFIIFYQNKPGLYVTLFLIISFPLFVSSYLICRARFAFFHRVFCKAKKSNDFSKIDKMSIRMVLAIVGSNLHLIDGDFKILDHIYEAYQSDFNVITFYAKYVALTFCHFDKLHELLIALKKLRNLTFGQQVISTFIEILSLQDENTHNEQKIGEMCSIVSTEFLRNLNLFWTEILLGRNERLVSLSNAVDNKFQTAVCLFTLLGTNRGKMNHSFEQFCAVSTLKVSDPVFPDQHSFFKLLYEPKFQAITYKGQADALQAKVFRYQPPLRSVHITAFLQKSQKSIFYLKFMIVSLPFIAALIFGILGLAISYLSYETIIPSWNLFYRLELAGLQIAAVYAAHPFLLLSYYDYINFTELTGEILNNYLFRTKLKDPYEDMDYILQRLVDNTPFVLQTFDDYNFPDLLIDLLETIVPVSLTSFSGAVRWNMTFVQYLSIISIRFAEQVKMDQETLISYFNNSLRITLMVQNSDNFLKTITSYLIHFADISHKACADRMNSLAFEMEMAMLAVVIILIIVSIILINGLFRSIDTLFEPLFLLPKVSISELIDKLSPKQADENDESQQHQQVDSQISYNLKQLAYERPQAYRTRRQTKLVYFFIIIFMIIILRIIICPSIAASSQGCIVSFEGMLAAESGYATEITLLKVMRDFCELLCRRIVGMTVPPDRNMLLIERMFNNTVDLQNEFAALSYAGADLPQIINSKFYFNSLRNGTTPLSNFTFIDKVSYLYTQLYMWIYHYTDDDDMHKTTVRSLLSLMLSAATQQIPNLNNDIYSNAKKDLQWTVDKCVLFVCLFMVIAFVLYIMIRFSPTLSIGSLDYAQPIFASIPPRSIHTFHQYLGTAEDDERSKDEDPRLANSIFDGDSTFQTMLDPLLLISSDGKIVSMSSSALQLFNIESPPAHSLFPDFMQIISVEDIEITLPITKAVSFTFHLKSDDESSQSVLFTNIFPTQKFETNGSTIFFGCLIEDITKLSALVAQLNYEANHVRLLTVQLAADPALDTFLNLTPFYSMMLPKLAIASFFVPSASSSLEITCLIQQALRDALSQVPSVSCFCRSIQMFRVVSGLSNTMMSTTETSTELVLFAQRFMFNISQIEEHMQTTLDVRCGIHLSGPYIGDVVSESPPLFELFGAAMTISSQIAASAVSKHVCISRDVYEAIFDQGFTITFEKEIRQVGGDEMSIHNVEPKTE